MAEQIAQLTDKRAEQLQVAELGWWQHAKWKMQRSWFYYDRRFLKYMPHFFTTVADVGCGPLPYFCNHNVVYEQAYAVDPNIHAYWEMGQYGERCPCELLESTEDLPSNHCEAVFCLNTLDHARYPGRLLQELGRIARPEGMIFIYVDVDKQPDRLHPHLLTWQWLHDKATRWFTPALSIQTTNWRLENPAAWFVGVKRGAT